MANSCWGQKKPGNHLSEYFLSFTNNDQILQRIHTEEDRKYACKDVICPTPFVLELILSTTENSWTRRPTFFITQRRYQEQHRRSILRKIAFGVHARIPSLWIPVSDDGQHRKWYLGGCDKYHWEDPCRKLCIMMASERLGQRLLEESHHCPNQLEPLEASLALAFQSLIAANISCLS
jgi:hypothetical protein